MAYAKKRTYKNKKSRTSLKGVKGVIIAVIVLAMFVGIFAIISSFFYTPERIIKSKIESIATDYYENYFYQDIASYKTTQSQLEKTMEKYTKEGFARITLRQLFFHKDEQHTDTADTISKYCDQDNTYIQFFPVAPFGSTDYRVEYTYSCEF